MTRRDLDRLLRGHAGLATTIYDAGGRATPIRFSRRALEDPKVWRSTMRRALGHTGYEPPVYCQADHDQLVRVMFRLADSSERESRRAA
jgi:hypothetical protein